jgi:hypothetical protein
MAVNWKKYLIITGIISIFCAIFIPEIIEYIDLNYLNPPKKFNPYITPNTYSLGWQLFYRTLIWFYIFYGGSIFLGFIYLIFKKLNGNLK